MQPRRPLSSEAHLQQRFGVARDTVRRAIGHLAELGLVRTVPGKGTYVRATTRTQVTPEPGMRIITRPATKGEQDELELDAGAWVLVIERPNGELDVLPGDGAEIRVE
nr:GntR family transcriptional regulator [Sinosporangium album]